MSKKKIIIITSVIISIILVLSIIGCIIVYNLNNNIKQKNLKVVIYQYYTSVDKKHLEPTIYDSFLFDENTTYDEYIYMLDNNQEYNHVVIENGKVIVTESNCYNGNCKRMIIDLKAEDFSLLNPNITTIECKPHGLKITLEEVK